MFGERLHSDISFPPPLPIKSKWLQDELRERRRHCHGLYYENTKRSEEPVVGSGVYDTVRVESSVLVETTTSVEESAHHIYSNMLEMRVRESTQECGSEDLETKIQQQQQRGEESQVPTQGESSFKEELIKQQEEEEDVAGEPRRESPPIPSPRKRKSPTSQVVDQQSPPPPVEVEVSEISEVNTPTTGTKPQQPLLQQSNESAYCCADKPPRSTRLERESVDGVRRLGSRLLTFYERRRTPSRGPEEVDKHDSPAAAAEVTETEPPNDNHVAHLTNLPPHLSPPRNAASVAWLFRRRLAARLGRSLSSFYERRVRSPVRKRLGWGGFNIIKSVRSCPPGVSSHLGKKKVEISHPLPCRQDGQPHLVSLAGSALSSIKLHSSPANVVQGPSITSQLQDLQAHLSEKRSSGGGDDDSVVLGYDDDAKGQGDFDALRNQVKDGSDFCKDLAAVLQERADLESTYSKSLSKLSSKLLKASRESTGSVAHAWQAVAVQLGVEGELHGLLSSTLTSALVKPLSKSTESHSKIRKSVESLVEKTARNLAEWRSLELKAKKGCWRSSREYEKVGKETGGQSSPPTAAGATLPPPGGGSGAPSSELRTRTSRIVIPNGGGDGGGKDPVKATAKLRKLSQQLTHSNLDYYNTTIRAERARLEWEGAVRNGSVCLRTLEEEKLVLLKELADNYLQQLTEYGPKLVGSIDCLRGPVGGQDTERDMGRILVKSEGGAEQLLPDFYAEDVSNNMDKERRRDFLIKYSHLIRTDLERERRGAGIQVGCHGNEQQHGLYDKVYYTQSILLYLEGARYKLENVLSDLEGRGREGSPIGRWISHQRDRSGVPVSVLRVPRGEREECLNGRGGVIMEGGGAGEVVDWGRGDHDGEGNKVYDDDFEDEFSSSSDGGGGGGSTSSQNNNNNIEELSPSPIKNSSTPSVGSALALYDYEASMYDELSIKVGDLINIHDKNEDGWWLGELRGVVGIFPATYVEEVGVAMETSIEQGLSSSPSTTNNDDVK